MSRRTGDWIEGFLAFTENTEPRVSYRRWVAISTVASALQRKCWVDWGTLTFYPNMYIVLVGPPAARKGTAMGFGKVFLDALGIKTAADETSRPRIVQALQESHATSQAKTGELCYHCSLTAFSTELTVFLGYDDKEMLTYLCKLYDCEKTFRYETVSRGTEEAPNVWFNLLGATTPAQLQSSVPEGFIGSGFTSRVIFVFEEDKGKTVIKPTLSAEQRVMMADLTADLGEIHNLCGRWTFEDGFEEVYGAWRVDAEETPPSTDPRMEYYAQRRPTHLFKLCLIFSAARSSEMIIRVADLEKAISVLTDTEAKMPHVFAGLGSNPLAALQHRVKQVIRKNGAMKLSALAEMFESDASRQQLVEALAALEQIGFLQMDVVNRRVVYAGRQKGVGE